MTRRLSFGGAILLALAVGLQGLTNPRLGTWKLNLETASFPGDTRTDVRVYDGQ